MQKGGLTERQKNLVEDNLGLVRIHLRRSVKGLERPRRDREWDDLFQEGCIGLARAAKQFDQDGDLPFAAFALRRIQSAVTVALRRRFETVHIPEVERVKQSAEGISQQVVPLTGDPATLQSNRARNPFDAGTDDTIARRIRRKYCDAVERAAAACKKAPTHRHDRPELIDRLAKDRLNIPEPAERVTLRRIARETNSSYARVVHTEKRLKQRVRSTLSADQELAQLRAEARRKPGGLDAAMDRQTRVSVSNATTECLRRLLDTLPPPRRGLILWQLFEQSGADALAVARSLFGRLPAERRAALLNRWVADHSVGR
jgi:RNA polymerase sigma factor (sigma-70 family)